MAALALVLVGGLLPSSPVARAAEVPEVCVEMSGHNDRCPRWSQHLDGPMRYVYGAMAQAVSPAGDRVYVTGVDTGSEPNVGSLGDGDWVTAGFDQATGKQAWTVRHASEPGEPDLPFDIAVSPDGRRVYVTGVADGRLVTIAYAGSTGARIWAADEAKGDAHVTQPSSIVMSPDGARVYVTAHHGESTATNAYDAASGTQLWQKVYDSGPGSDEPVSLAVSPDGSRVYTLVLTPTASAATVAYDAATGTELWLARRGGGAGGSFFPVALAADGAHAYVAGSTGSGSGPYRTVAHRADDGVESWAALYGGTRDVPAALSVGGGRVFVTGKSIGAVSRASDYATVAYTSATGAQTWVAHQDIALNDSAQAVEVSPDGGRVYVSGSSDGRAATAAYDAASGIRAWTARSTELLESPPANSGVDSLAVGVSRDSHRVFVTARAMDPSDVATDYAVMAYDADDDSPELLSFPTPGVTTAPTEPIEGGFSVMSLAHSYPSVSGPAVQWDGQSTGGPFRYNSNACTANSPINNISTNLTTYNSRLLGSASPAATRVHGLEFEVGDGPPGRANSRTLTGTITLVACNRMGGPTSPALDRTPDTERPKVTLAFTAIAEKTDQPLAGTGGLLGEVTTSREVRLEGDVRLTGGTGVYEDLAGAGRIHGYLMCLAADGVTAGDCPGGLFRDAGFTTTGWYRDPTVAELGVNAPVPASELPPPGFDSNPPADGASPIEGSFGLKAMVHSIQALTGPGEVAEDDAWDGASKGTFRYNARPCSEEAPVNNLSTNLTTYNSRLPASASPASTRSHSFEFSVEEATGGDPVPIEGGITVVACRRIGGSEPFALGVQTPDWAKPRIFVKFSGTAQRMNSQDVRFEGEFTINGGTGIYQDLRGSGRIHGYLFCFSAAGGGGGCRRSQPYSDAQYTMNGWYSDPTVAELGVGPTKVGFTEDSPRSGQYSDQVTPRATLQDSEGKPMADAAVDFELAGTGGTKAWTATTDAHGVAGLPVTLDLTPGVYDLSVRYPGSEKRGPSSDKVAFTFAKEATVTALSVEGQTPKRTLRTQVADDDAQRLPGVTVQFSAGGKPIGASTTDANGEATLVVPPRYQGGSHRFGATFAGDERYLASSGEART